MEIPSTAHQGIVQYKRILKCITVGYRTGLILGRCLVLKPLTSSSPPLPHAAPAPLAPSPTQLSTSSPINCRGDVMAWVARSKFLFKSEGESCIQTGSEMLDHHSNTTYVYHSPLSDNYHILECSQLLTVSLRGGPVPSQSQKPLSVRP